MSSDSAYISDIADTLNAEFIMQYLGHYLGIVIDRDGKGVRMHQKPYKTERVDLFDHLPKTHTLVMTSCHLVSSSVWSHDSRRVLGRDIIMSLLSIPADSGSTYVPGCAYQTRYCLCCMNASRYNARPTYASCKAVLHILRYVVTLVIRAFSSQISLTRIHWFLIRMQIGDLDTSRLTTGNIFYLCGAPMAWQMRLHPTVAPFTMKAKTCVPMPLFI